MVQPLEKRETVELLMREVKPVEIRCENII